MNNLISTREATKKDIEAILTIYNQGIEDRIATLETDQKDLTYMINWYNQHQERYKILVAEQHHEVIWTRNILM